jgi:hypothetical protein
VVQNNSRFNGASCAAAFHQRLALRRFAATILRRFLSLGFSKVLTKLLGQAFFSQAFLKRRNTFSDFASAAFYSNHKYHPFKADPEFARSHQARCKRQYGIRTPVGGRKSSVLGLERYRHAGRLQQRSKEVNQRRAKIKRDLIAL